MTIRDDNARETFFGCVYRNAQSSPSEIGRFFAHQVHDQKELTTKVVELMDAAFTVAMAESKDLRMQLSAQRLRADTAEAELKVVRKSREDELENYNAMIADLAAAERRNAEQHALLLRCKEVFDNCCGMADQKTRVDWYANYLVPTKVDLNAALNPNPEAESHES